MSKSDAASTMSPGKSEGGSGDRRPAADGKGVSGDHGPEDGKDSGRFAKKQDEQRPRHNVFIGNLSIFTSNQKLKDFFEAKFAIFDQQNDFWILDKTIKLFSDWPNVIMIFDK